VDYPILSSVPESSFLCYFSARITDLMKVAMQYQIAMPNLMCKFIFKCLAHVSLSSCYFSVGITELIKVAI
jgi:hypothetical protein